MTVLLEFMVLPFDFAVELFKVVLRFNDWPNKPIVFDVAFFICLEITLLFDFLERID